MSPVSHVRLGLIGVLCLSLGLSCINEERATSEEKERAVAEALKAYSEAQRNGADFSNGPCIAEEVIDDWSVDIAHDPRQDVDDKPENQCRFYREGRTHHFVELSPDGTVLRIK